MTRLAELTEFLGEAFQRRYELVGELGRGGFGAVYHGRQLSTGQDVAIKLLQPDLDATPNRQRREMERWQRELKVCAQLHHPHIVRLIDSIITPYNDFIIVFELVAGENLAEMLSRRGALPPAEAMDLMMQVLDALVCAHDEGVIHRDIKPHNIMLTRTGVRQHAVVVDFGVGGLLEETQGRDNARLTPSREQVGTPSYSSPEQLRGEPTGPTTDLYSWALVFLECLTGQRVFQGRSWAQVLYQQLSPQPVRMPEQLRAHPLGYLLARALHKDHTRRPHDLREMWREIEITSVEGLAGLAETGLPTMVLSGERRPVTALCCRLSLEQRKPRVPGTLDDALDDEALDDLMFAQQSVCTELITRYEGQVASVIGDQVLGFFGLPQAREHDTRRALYAAQRIAEQMQALNARLVRERGVRVHVHIGLHTGTILTTPGAGDTFSRKGGVTASVANELEWLAERDEVLISEDMYEQLRHHAMFDPAGSYHSRRLGRQVSTYRLAEAPSFSTSIARVQSGPVLPLIGREEELGVLVACWSRACVGRGQRVLLRGEAGIGKSRLVEELRGMAQQDHAHIIELRCLPEQRHTALGPLTSALRELCSEHGADVQSGLRALLPRLGLPAQPHAAQLAMLLELQCDPGDPAPCPMELERARASALALLVEMAFQMPMLLLVEDLQWCDAATLSFLSALLEDIPSTPLMLLATTRLGHRIELELGALSILEVERLDMEAARRLIQHIAGDELFDARLVDQLIQRTDGNPLFIDELVRMLTHEHDPTRSGTLPTHTIPNTLRSSLVARLDQLGGARHTAQIASVLGREFHEEILQVMLQREPHTLREEMSTLVRHAVIHRQRRARGRVYSFKHALMRDAAYESLIRPDRKRYHRLAALAMETLRDDPRMDITAAALASHWGLAEFFEKAVEYSLQAAHHALIRDAAEEAAHFVETARGWLERVPPDRSAPFEQELRALTFPPDAHQPAVPAITPALPVAQAAAARILAHARLHDTSER